MQKFCACNAKGERTLAGLAQQFDAQPNPTTEWMRQRENAWGMCFK
ncbi:hypothetical protein SAMN03159335_03688 [Burkholderia cepacia]|nr:hypothetical protein SAMN03159335_03688 [Burkholderia cepacia]